MKSVDQLVLEQFIEEYGVVERPLKFGNPSHCEECSEANSLLMGQTPEDLDREELLEPSKGWFFSWMGADGWRYLLPGFIRVALIDPEANICILLDRVQSEYITTLSESQRESLYKVLDYIRRCGYASVNEERLRLRLAMELTKPNNAQHTNLIHARQPKI